MDGAVDSASSQESGVGGVHDGVDPLGGDVAENCFDRDCSHRFRLRPHPGWRPAIAFACITLTVHSALDSVGLTALVATRLAEQQISCNVIAGYHHDHLLVPADRADDAVALLTGLSTTA